MFFSKLKIYPSDFDKSFLPLIKLYQVGCLFLFISLTACDSKLSIMAQTMSTAETPPATTSEPSQPVEQESAPIENTVSDSVTQTPTTTSTGSGPTASSVVDPPPLVPAASSFKLAFVNCKNPDLALILKGTKVSLCNGTIGTGTFDPVAPLPSCSTEGQSVCVPTATFAAVNTTGLAAKVLTNQTVANIAGTALPESHVDCASDGSMGCVATGTVYRAAEASRITPTNIKSGINLAGTAGTYGPACTTDGGFDCIVDGTAFKSALKSNFSSADIKSGITIGAVSGLANLESHSNCATDGAIGCISSASYPAADASVATATNIKTGIAIAGVTGQFPSASARLTGDTATTDLVSTAASIAAGNYEFWDSAGNYYSGTVSDAGTITPTTTNQTFSTSLYRTFTVVGDTDLVAKNIKSGVAIFGVTGNYPSATSPINGASAVPDLDLSTFNAKMKSQAEFEWFDSIGRRHFKTGSSDINATNIASGVTLFGTTGTLTSTAANCTADGQVNCLTTATYKDVDISSVTQWDIRKGKTIGGIQGELAFFNNMANTTFFNRTTGTAAAAGLDIYDTIDDYDNGGIFPTQNAGTWPQATGVNWIRDAGSDTGAGGGYANDGVCNGTEDCVFQDRITKLSWARADSTTRDWEGAITYCETLNYGGYTDWRLPTKKEAYQAYIDGVWTLGDPLLLNLKIANYFWTATTYSGNLTQAWVIFYERGMNSWYYKYSTTQYVLCVR